MYSSESLHSVRCISDAAWTNSFALYDACAIVLMSPWPSMEKPATGLPVFLMPSTMRCVYPGSMPITITAATFGFEPVPIIVRKNKSRSSPN